MGKNTNMKTKYTGGQKYAATLCCGFNCVGTPTEVKGKIKIHKKYCLKC